VGTTDTVHSASSPVLVKREGKIVTVTLNRPEDGNRWRKETLLAFSDRRGAPQGRRRRS
jgi:hypothetical protein